MTRTNMTENTCDTHSSTIEFGTQTTVCNINLSSRSSSLSLSCKQKYLREREGNFHSFDWHVLRPRMTYNHNLPTLYTPAPPYLYIHGSYMYMYHLGAHFLSNSLCSNTRKYISPIKLIPSPSQHPFQFCQHRWMACWAHHISFTTHNTAWGHKEGSIITSSILLTHLNKLGWNL